MFPHFSAKHTWSASVEAPAEVIGEIGYGTEYYTGPFLPGETVQIAKINATNIGNATGQIHCKVCANPGTGSETTLYSQTWTIDPGYGREANVSAAAPSTPGTWPLGVKVWGETEAEPSW